MRIAIGSDETGFDLKEEVRKRLANEKTYELIDVTGEDAEDAAPYLNTATAVAELIQMGDAERGLLFCAYGVEGAIVANKYKNVYAAPCETAEAARQSRIVADANVLCVGSEFTKTEQAMELIQVFLATEFAQGVTEEEQEELADNVEEIQWMEDDIFDEE